MELTFRAGLMLIGSNCFASKHTQKQCCTKAVSLSVAGDGKTERCDCLRSISIIDRGACNLRFFHV